MEPDKHFQYNLYENTSVRDTARIHAELTDAITQYETVYIDVRAVQSIDVSILQLLAAARTTAIVQGRTVTLLTEPRNPFEAAAGAAGLLGNEGAPRTNDECFWTGGAATEGELI